jgi:hypothetical protein
MPEFYALNFVLNACHKVNMIKTGNAYVSHTSWDYRVKVINMKVPLLLEQCLKKHLVEETTFSYSSSKLQNPADFVSVCKFVL